jgi:hypothetical protein
MSLIFETQPGYAVQIASVNGGNPLSLSVAGFGDAPQSRAIITQVSLRRGENVQFVHSLSDLIYVYSFGEHVGQITAAGIAFVGMCEGGGPGIDYVNDWYDRNRVDNNPTPLPLLIGLTPFRGYLTDLEADVARPDTRLASFGLHFRTLPQGRRR